MRILATVLVVLALCGYAVVSHAAEENVVHVKNPAPGEHVVVPCRDAKRIILDFDIKDTKCELSENNIVFHYDNGTIVTLEGILPSDGNLDKLGDVVLQIGQGEIYPAVAGVGYANARRVAGNSPRPQRQTLIDDLPCRMEG